MSKTFKALQRAAKERAAKLRQEQKEPHSTEPAQGAPPKAGTARIIALAKADKPGMAAPTPPPPATIDPGRPSGEMDASLRNILEEALSPHNPNLVIGNDGWLQGVLDPIICKELLSKYALLHCLRKDAENSYWFWASRQESVEMVERCGLELDPF